MKTLVLDISLRKLYALLSGPDMISILGISLLVKLVSEVGFSPRPIQSIYGTLKITSRMYILSLCRT
jgi:hypothetical protein